MRTCKICLIEKELNEFEKCRNQCRKCRNEKMKQYQKQYHKEYNKKYQKTDKYKEYHKKYQKTDKSKNYRREYQIEYLKCRSCKLFQTHNKTNYLCANCNPNAKQSKGKLEIIQYLQENNIEFIRQYKFQNQNRDTKLCRYDFYLPKLNTIIEFMGGQHYKFIHHFHRTNDYYLKCWYMDILKKEFCNNNGINFIEIKYNEDIKLKLQIENII